MLSGRRLVVPDQLAGRGAERQDRGQVEVVATAGAAPRAIVHARVAGPDVEQVELGVEGHGIPDRAAETGFPERVRRPGLGGALELRMLVGAVLAGRHGVEAPGQLSGVEMIGGEVAAHAEIGTAIADHDQVAHDARRSGDRVGLAEVGGPDAPERVAIVGVERDQPSVEGAQVDASMGVGHAAIHDVAARMPGLPARHLGVVPPELASGPGVQGEDDAPGSGGVEGPVDDQGGGFETSL